MKLLLSTAVIALGLQTAPAVAQTGPAPGTDRVRIAYDEPQHGKHQAIRAMMQERRILETVGALLGAFRLPRDMTLEVRGCSGREGAFYSSDRVVFCYEYAELVERYAPKVATPGGVPRDDAMVGAILDTILHEAGHGIIEQLDIPVLGREEDAADFFSVYLLLQFLPEDAKRLIEGVAFVMGSEGREDLTEKLAPQTLGGAHALEAQRHFNGLCLAFGANPALFDNVPPAGLPPWRARNCGDEFALLKRAFGKVILPHVDEAKLREAIAQARFDWKPLATARGTFDAPPLGDGSGVRARRGGGAGSRR
jgi:hypothetical protein